MDPGKSFDMSTGKMKNIVQRLFRMRHRFRVAVPENIEVLKKRLAHTRLNNPVDNGNDFNLFYNLGGAFDQEAESLTMGDLSRHMKVPLSTATRIVDWLVFNGYAQRLSDPDDRRIVRVMLTEIGRATYCEIDAFFLERIERLMRDFSPEERSTFQVLFEKIVISMEQEI